MKQSHEKVFFVRGKLLQQVGPESWTLNILHLQGFKTGAAFGRFTLRVTEVPQICGV